MKLKLPQPKRLSSVMSLFFLCILQTASYGQCSEGINQTFAILNFGSGNVYYNLQSTSGNPNFESANLGSFCPNGTLILEGGQNQVYKCNGADIWQNQIWYRIYLTSASPTGAFTPITEYYQSGYSNGCGGADQTWEANGANINVLSGLSAGTYYLEVYSTADYQYCGSGTIYASNSSYNYRATFTVNATPTVTVNSPRICAGNTATLTATGGTSYVWNNDSAKTSITTATAGTYTVTATNSSGCTASASGTVTVNPNPTAYAGDDTFVDFVTNVVLGDSTPIGGTAPYTFAWTPGTGLSDSTIQFPICTPLATTKYYLTVTDSNGCTNTDSVIVAFNKGNNPLTDIKYSAQNVALTDSGQFLEFDVFASDTPTNLLFSQGQIYVSFDTTYFGSHLVTSGAITVSKGQAIDSPYYNLTVVDSTASMIKLSVTHTANPSSLTNLDSVNQQLCHIKLRVASVGTPFANFDSVLMVGQSLYKRSVSGLEFPYDLVQVSGLVGALRSDDINVQITSVNYSTNPMTFDVQVQSGSGDYFYSADIDITYNTNNFGTNVVSNGHLNCTSNFDVSDYSLNPTTDANSNTFKISIQGSFDANGNPYDPGHPPTYSYPTLGSYVTIATCSLSVQNCCYFSTGGDYLTVSSVSANYATFGYDDNGDPTDSANDWTATQDNSGAYTPGSLTGYSSNTSICPNSSPTPTITGIYAPDASQNITAGTYSVLTITGSGFGCSTGQVLFPNADTGGTGMMHTQTPDIQTWDDDQITVWVPSIQDGPGGGRPAGSGQIEVITPAGDTSNLSPDALTIPYAITNYRDASNNPIIGGFKNQDSMGGYRFTPDSLINPTALGTITRAMNDWNCRTGENFMMGSPASNQTATYNHINSIFFGTPGGDFLALTIVSVALNINCTSGSVVVAPIQDIDMIINNASTFDQTDTPTPAAGTTSLLYAIRHEFGHASLLGHVDDMSDLMYYYEGVGITALPISYNNASGVDYILTEIDPNYLASCFNTSIRTFSVGCLINGINNLGGSNPFNVSVYPNPFNESITISANLNESADVKVKIFDVLGQLVESQDYGVRAGSVEESVNVSQVSAGLYVVQVTINNSTFQTKLVKK